MLFYYAPSLEDSMSMPMSPLVKVPLTYPSPLTLSLAKKRPFTWVVSIIPRNQLHHYLTPGHPHLQMQAETEAPDYVEQIDGDMKFTFKRKDFLKQQVG